MKLRHVLVVLLAGGALAATTAKKPAPRPSPSKTGKPAPGKPAPRKPSAPLGDQEAVARWIKLLTPREKAAQLVMVPFSGFTPRAKSKESRKFYQLTAVEHVGGLVLINGPGGRPNAPDVAGLLNKLQNSAKVPYLVAGDFERGLSMRIDGTTVFPHAMAYSAAGDTVLARTEGQISAREARALGFHWIFSPDADVNNNPDNPIINIRSYGEDPADVSRMVSAFIEGAHSVGGTRVMVTAKHFPGHGDTSTDTHHNLAVIPGDRPRLEKVEWAPFRAAIAKGVDAVMTGHLAVPALDDANLPATLSTKILSGTLRDELGFHGIVVTDALQMSGLAQGFTSGEAAVRALEAGADVLLMPSDPVAAISAVAAAVRTGRISQKRLDESLQRVLLAKSKAGLANQRNVEVSAISSGVDTSGHRAAAQAISDRSITLVRNQAGFLPLHKAAPSTAFFILAENRKGVEGQAMASELRRRVPDAPIIQVEAGMPEADLEAAAAQAGNASRYVVVAFASVAAFKGNPPLGGGLPRFVQNLAGQGKPVALVAMGNPYLLRNFPDVAVYMTTYSTVPPSEVSAVRALFGEISVTGKLPVTIPGLAKYGDGLSLPARRP